VVSAAGRRQRYSLMLVLDLEATCNRRKDLAPVEIIELSAVLLDARQLQVKGEFQAYVRPTQHPVLDPFCIELTGITQQQVDSGAPLADALQRLDDWLTQLGALEQHVTLLPVTWTDWDLQVCMEQECEWRGIIKPPYFGYWCNLKKAFLYKYHQSPSLKKAVHMAGLTWEGRAHSGIDDARNTCSLLLHLIRDKGAVLTVTGSFAGAQLPGTTAAAGHPRPAAAAAAARPAEPAAALETPGQVLQGDTASVSDQQAAAGTSAALLGPACSTGTAPSSSTSDPPPSQHTDQQAGPSSQTPTATITTTRHNSSGALKQTLLRPHAPRGSHDPFRSGAWDGCCRCGVKAHLRTTKKPGANHGRSFFSCGSWRITDKGKQCDFFSWVDGGEKKEGG